MEVDTKEKRIRIKFDKVKKHLTTVDRKLIKYIFLQYVNDNSFINKWVGSPQKACCILSVGNNYTFEIEIAESKAYGGGRSFIKVQISEY